MPVSYILCRFVKNYANPETLCFPFFMPSGKPENDNLSFWGTKLSKLSKKKLPIHLKFFYIKLSLI